jgi:hypothetical protein
LRRLAFAVAEFGFVIFGGRGLRAWHAREFKAARLLTPDLSEYLVLAEVGRLLLRDVILKFAEGGQGMSGEVQARLLNRLATELRAVEWCALFSYQLQAMSLAANVLEHAHVLAYVGRSERRANEWLTHDEFERSYPGSVKKAIKGSLEEQGRPQDHLHMEYKAYGALCLAKHGNPQALKNYGVEADETRMILHYGPFVSVATPLQAKFALYQAVRAVAMAGYAAAAPRYGSETVLAVRAVSLLGDLNRLQERDLPWIARDVEAEA